MTTNTQAIIMIIIIISEKLQNIRQNEKPESGFNSRKKKLAKVKI